MLNFIARRIAYGVLILLGVNLLTFMLFFTVNTPDDMARLMKLAQWQAGEIERLRERVFELQADPKSGDVIPLAEPRCGDLRRSAERCITAWTVVRGGVWDPNGLMDEHMAALRKALGPNSNSQTPIVR